jgi:hypothetical protein
VSLNQTDLGFSLSGVTLKGKQLFQKECVGILTIFEKPLRMRYIFIAGLLLTLLTSSGFAQVRDECARLYYSGKDYSYSNNKSDLRMGYDTLRFFIESCAIVPNVADGAPAWGAFSRIDKCVSDMDTTNIRWLEYREWLKKVLYLSDDSMYYCSDFNSMILTFIYLVPGKGVDYNGGIALIDYVLEHNRCPDQTLYWLNQRQSTRDYQVEIWKDTVTDSLKTPLDTSAVNIDSIGFSILRGPQHGAVKTYSPSTIGFGELHASKNPFTDETTLETTISDAMMFRLEVFDVLGKQLYSENEFFSSGDVRWKLDGKILPKGSLYVRVSTIGGGVKTIKLVKD